MNKYDIENLLGATVGICAFSELKDKLIDCRNKEKIPTGAKSVILFVFPYKVKEEKPANICRYSAVADYHKVCEDILKKHVETLKKQHNNNNFVHFVDNSPIPEVCAANKAGLGDVGKNGLLITKEYGSYVFLGEIVTDLEIEAENNYSECINCGACKKACPVGLDKEKCLSRLTQKKGELSCEEKALIIKGGCVWGCDICAEVCPLNKNAKVTYIDEFLNSYKDSYVYGEDITGRAYAWRGEAVIKRNYDILKDR